MKRTLVCTFLLLSLLGCAPYPPEPNQVQNLPSPSGQFLLSVPIETRTPEETGRRWIVTIHNTNGVQMYRDSTSKFVPMLNVYWTWDSEGRAWLYNSDDAGVWFWELKGTNWIKHQWGYVEEKMTKRDIFPPAGLNPYDRHPENTVSNTH